MQDTDILQFFDKLSVAAAAETLPRFRKLTDVSNKEKFGFDPVTEADKQAERAVRELIRRHHPDHGIIGEEFGSENPDAEYCWIIDPVDGTRAFISGIPLWGTLIGLYKGGKPYAGVMDQPFTGERFTGIPGESLLSKNGKTTHLKTSSVSKLEQATLMTTDPGLFRDNEALQFDALADQVQLRRYGTDCYGYCMVAAGQAELVLEAGLSVYDIAALIPVIEGAGGFVTNWQGDDASHGGQILAAANETIHRHAIDVLNG